MGSNQPLVLVFRLEEVMHFFHFDRGSETLTLGGGAHGHRGFYHRLILLDRCTYDRCSQTFSCRPVAERGGDPGWYGLPQRRW